MVRKGRLTGILLSIGLMTMCMMGCGAADDTAGTGEEIRADASDAMGDDNEGGNAAAGESAAAGAGEQAGDETVAQENMGLGGSGSTEQSEVEAAEEEVVLTGLTLSILGDSISTYDGWIPEGFHVFYPISGELTDVSQTWWMKLLDDTGMELCSNNSSSGSTCIGDSLSVGEPQYGCSTYRLSHLTGSQGKMPDIIIIYMGTNDLLNSIPIGDNDGTRLVEEGIIENFSDAYCLILDKLLSDYPAAQIYCCTLLQVGDWGINQTFVAFTNGLGLTAEDYSGQIQTIAESKGLSVIDLYHCGIEIDNLADTTTDGVHLTSSGMKYVESAVLDGIRKAAGE